MAPTAGTGAASQVVNSKNPDGTDVFNINTLSPDELGKLLETDDYDLDLDIPDNLFGPDGHINMDFDDADFDDGQAMQHAHTAPVQDHDQMEAARSVLASMDSAIAQEHSVHMHHAHSAPSHMFHQPQQFAQQPIYIRDAAGRFIQVGGGGAADVGPTILSGVPFHPQGGQVQYHVQQSMVHHLANPFPHFMPVHESGSVQNSPKKSPARKKRRKKGTTETFQQQRVRAYLGYTQHPKTNELLRHGDALKAYTKDNKEIPAIKNIFETFSKNGGFTHQPPPTTFSGPVVNIEAQVGGPICSNIVRQELESEQRVKDSEMNANGIGNEECSMFGVTREVWSLFWKAHVKKPAAEGQEEEPVFCGEFPSMDQAARAHDMVAIKILGEETALNFPLEQYKAILPIIHGNSEEQLVSAVVKDGELSKQRTSKFKGVRRTGANHYEATIDAEMVARALQQDAKGKEKASQAAMEGHYGVHHHTNTFHA
jgi:hypothetical protein